MHAASSKAESQPVADKTRGLDSIDTSVSPFERWIFSGKFPPISGGLGFVLSIVFGFTENWVLVTATVVSFGSVVGVALLGRAYARQLRLRYQISKAAVVAEASRARVQHAGAMEALHLFLREARDEALRFSDRYENLLERAAEGTEEPSVSVELGHLRDDCLRKLLEQLLRVFVPIVRPDASLWSAIRIVRKSEGANYYETLLRAGGVDNDRAINSTSVREDRGLPRHLKEQHSLGNGIVILDESRTDDQWEANPNDQRGDDHSVLAGPIFLRAEGRDQLVMILYLNSPISQEVFDEQHKPYMKCCVDVLSTVISVITNLVPEPEDPRQEAPSEQSRGQANPAP